jgi:hypothetical protein
LRRPMDENATIGKLREVYLNGRLTGLVRQALQISDQTGGHPEFDVAGWDELHRRRQAAEFELLALLQDQIAYPG